MTRYSRFWILMAITLAAGCATKHGVDQREPARLVGKDNDVRIDAQVLADRIGPGLAISLTYEIENLREDPIAIADIVPVAEYDSETEVITVQLGSEVPGNEFLPRLIEIRSGEKQIFRGSARVNANVARAGFRRGPQQLRVRLSFLGDIGEFRMLVGITERAVRDPELANRLFMPWVNSQKVVTTNSIPVDLRAEPATTPDRIRGARRSLSGRRGE